VPLKTNALERLILTRLNFAPALLLDYFSTLGFRAALVGIVHGLSEDENRRLIGRVSAALNPGGRIVLLEQFAGRRRGRPSMPSTACST
jgi:hypothetical protein